MKLALCGAWLLLLASVAAAELKPEQIALVVNANIPESEEVARFYCKARGVPEAQIIPLKLPVGDEIIFDSFEQYVRPTVRQWLIAHDLQRQIRCLVTCYGVPLRIGDRVNSPRENNELTQLQSLHRELVNRLAEVVTAAEARAGELDTVGTTLPTTGPTDDLLGRLTRVARRLDGIAHRGGTAATGAGIELAKLSGQISQPVSSDNVLLSSPPTTQPDLATAKVWAEQAYDESARSQLRYLAAQKLGLVEMIRLVSAQVQYLVPSATGAAFDSELALVGWPAYPHSNWLGNPMSAAYQGPPMPPLLMTMRLDAPSPQGVRDLIATGIEVERAGLSGKIVIDTRGLSPADASGKPDPYGMFDERLRKLATTLKAKASLPVVVDEKPDVLPPGSVDGVAVYIGWYSVHKYVPGMKFVRGAVGYHVASFELLNLRNPREPGWVRGLLLDGVVSTEGPVAEPYLHSFPIPEIYFPLLLSGKLPMADVYWAATPLVSWMQAGIGDPLYTPFAKQPAMKLEDLDPALQATIKARQGSDR